MICSGAETFHHLAETLLRLALILYCVHETYGIRARRLVDHWQDGLVQVVRKTRCGLGHTGNTFAENPEQDIVDSLIVALQEGKLIETGRTCKSAHGRSGTAKVGEQYLSSFRIDEVVLRSTKEVDRSDMADQVLRDRQIDPFLTTSRHSQSPCLRSSRSGY